MLVVAGLILGQVKNFLVKIFLFEVVANLSLHSKQLGQICSDIHDIAILIEL